MFCRYYVGFSYFAAFRTGLLEGHEYRFGLAVESLFIVFATRSEIIKLVAAAVAQKWDKNRFNGGMKG